MTTYNEQEAMQGVAQRFAKAAEELRLSGAQLFREGIVTNDQVLSKIKNGWQKPPKKAIELFCQKYNVSAAWLYTGEGNMFLGRMMPIEQNTEKAMKYNSITLISRNAWIATGSLFQQLLPPPQSFHRLVTSTYGVSTATSPWSQSSCRAIPLP